MLGPGLVAGSFKYDLLRGFGARASRWPASGEAGLTKGSPFIIFSVSSAIHVATRTLLAGRFRLVAF